MAEIAMTQYDYEKQIMSQQKTLDAIILNKKLRDVAKSMLGCKYWMLLCRERNDYTVFNVISPTFSDVDLVREELAGVLSSRDGVVDIRQREDGNWEIWTAADGDAAMYMLFEYDWGVVEI